MATFWITKYALSAPIFSINSEVGNYDLILDTRSGTYGWSTFKLDREAFANEADARADAEARRAKKITSLKKQIAKLEKMTF